MSVCLLFAYSGERIEPKSFLKVFLVPETCSCLSSPHVCCSENPPLKKLTGGNACRNTADGYEDHEGSHGWQGYEVTVRGTMGEFIRTILNAFQT